MTAQVATGSGSINKRLRTSSSSDEHEHGGFKRTRRPNYYYILAPESTENECSDSSVETVYSIQAHSTDIAKDTSDTSDCTNSVIEYDVVSLSDEQVFPFVSRDSSSSPEDVDKIQTPTMELVLSQGSASSESEKSITTEILKFQNLNKFYLFTTCALCGMKMPAIPYRYCLKCYKIRKDFFPPRPKGRKQNIKKKVVHQDSGVSLNSVESCSNYSQNLLQEIAATTNKTSEDSTTSNSVCGTCLEHPKDGGYVHTNIVHVYACYACSKRILKQTGRCPICNTRVNKICKVITV